MEIILYTTHCPKCSIIEKKLNMKQITYTEETDTNVMTSLGIDAVPVLSVDGRMMSFRDANNWINEQGV